MNIHLKAAWRNLFRNKRRTFITGTAIALGLAALIFTDALVKGTTDSLINTATGSFSGEGQIHGAGFRETQEADRVIAGADDILARLAGDPRVKTFTPRTLNFAMASSASEVSPVLMVGVEPDSERKFSKFGEAIVEGRFFEDIAAAGKSGGSSQDIVLGVKLAETLQARLGDRIVLTAAQAGSDNLAQEMFRISGIYRFAIDEMDKGMVFVRLSKAQDVLDLKKGVHQIALTLKDPKVASNETYPLWKDYSNDGNEAVGWPVLFPQLKAVSALAGFATAIIGILLFGIIALGIINTLFMSVYERMFEFGVLRAVGTRPGGIRKLVVYEAGALGLLSSGLGIILGFVVTFIICKTGLDYRGIEYMGVSFKDLLYPVMTVEQFIIYPIIVFLFTVLVGLYPAGYASKMSITKAMRRTL
jgi:ABC-type lipoprotein release transport system permease subunit